MVNGLGAQFRPWAIIHKLLNYEFVSIKLSGSELFGY